MFQTGISTDAPPPVTGWFNLKLRQVTTSFSSAIKKVPECTPVNNRIGSMTPKYYFIGDGCICWSFGHEISSENSAMVLACYRRLKDNRLMEELGVYDLVPAYTELAVHFDPSCGHPDRLVRVVEQAIEQLAADSDKSSPLTGKIHRIPVDYNGADLERVAELNDLTAAEVIRLHSLGEYMVAMVGFLPHFPYLIGLDRRLETPRLDVPRKAIPAGSVAIGGAQTGIYPRESPGGWNIIGQADPELLVTIQPGDRIEFQSTGNP